MQPTIFSTVGDGLWSRSAKPVLITDIKLAWTNDEQDFGELCVYFDTAYWNVDQDGLIYTDSNFLQDLQLCLEQQGLLGMDVSYSEQGMQGTDYVSCDVGAGFIASWREKFDAFVN